MSYVRGATDRVEAERILGDALRTVRLLREQLECVAANLDKGMSRSIQRLQARTIRETLREVGCDVEDRGAGVQRVRP